MAKTLPVPAGAEAWTNTPTGVLDLNGFVHGFYLSRAWTVETELATRRGFVTSTRHGWISADGSQSDIFLVQFRSAAGAQSMYLDLTQGWKQNPSQGTTFTDPALHASGFVVSNLDALGNARVELTTAHGNVLVRVTYWSAAAPDRAAAESLLQRQINALGA